MTSALRAFRVAGAACVVAAAGACKSSGDTGGAPSDRTVVPFTSFQNVAPGTTTGMQGTSQTNSGTHVTAAGVTSVTSVELPFSSAGGIELGFDESRQLRTVRLTSPQSQVDFDRRTSGHTVGCAGGVCTATSPTATATVMDAVALGWNYQTFGVWNILGNPTSWQVGSVIAGNHTPMGQLPTVGSATFTGFARGFYVDAAGARFSTAADLSANVNWGTRSVAFSTANTVLTNVNTNAVAANNGLNLTGNVPFQLPVGAASFSGTLTTTDGSLLGSTTGFFYGPNAEEVGGTYRLTTPARAAGANSTDLPSLVGAYGGRRP